MTPEQAFRIWFKAFTENYAGSGLVSDPETVAWQAFQAGLTYAKTEEV